ncbi:MAG: outer membrane protein assembly factor BamB family protein [Longimicrobiales bacterium]
MQIFSDEEVQVDALRALRRLRTRLLTSSALGLALAVNGCKDAVTDPVVRPDSLPAWVEMLPSERPLFFIGMTYRIGARTVAADGTWLKGARLNPQLFRWSSDAPDIVTVDSLGVVRAVSEGTARVSATSGEATGTATVTVRDAIRRAWSHPLGATPGWGIAIGGDGTIYVPARHSLEAVAPGGERRWSVPTSGVSFKPAIAPDGTVYFGTSAAFMAVDRSGAVRWVLPNSGKEVVTSPAIGPDGTVYVASLDSILHAVDPAGQKRWEFKAGGRLWSPVVARDGTILIGADVGYLYAVGPDGKERWVFRTGGAIQSTPAIGADGTIYFGSEDQHLYALSPEGKLKWSVPLPLARAYSTPAIGSDGTVYIGGDGLHAVDAGGRLRWTYPGPNPRSGTMLFLTPVVAPDGSIYVGGRNLYALAPDGTLKWEYPTRLPTYHTIVGLDGTVLATGDSTLYAIVERGR